MMMKRFLCICGKQKQEMQIADFLNRDDEDDCKMGGKRRGGGGGSGDCVCYSPRSILSRWVASLKRGSRERSSARSGVALGGCEEKRDSEWERVRKKDDGESVDQSLLVGCSTNGAKGESSSSLLEESNRPSGMLASLGRYTKELSFNLGLGVALVFLIAASKNEFNKMMELRTQMEMLLKEAKDGMQRKDVVSKHSESNDNLADSTTDFHEVGSTSNHLAIQNCASSDHLVEAEISMQCHQYAKCDTPRRECAVGINRLEEELEAELERLQHSLDTESSPEHSQQQGREMVVEDNAPARSLQINVEEVDDHEDADTAENHGVSPKELERRLHELLEERQQERITELESALECAKHKLHEKEMEASWWKDTARLISKHVLETTPMSR